ncbi:hypothetical protein VDGD_20775 [Verticillium dahliae]|nr:hypothetical protein VDGD_20775 [Verticillium dahliae]
MCVCEREKRCIPSTSWTRTSFQNRLLSPPLTPFIDAALRISCAISSISACLFRRASLAAASWLSLLSAENSAADRGASGGGPVPTTGATSAVLKTVEERLRRDWRSRGAVAVAMRGMA